MRDDERHVSVEVAEVSRQHRTGNGNPVRVLTTTRGQEFRAVGKIPARLNEHLIGQTVRLTIRGHFINAVAVLPAPEGLSGPQRAPHSQDEAQADMQALWREQALSTLPLDKVERGG